MIAALVLIAVAGYLLVCMATGFGPPGDLSGFRADNTPLRRRFRQPVPQVMAGLRELLEGID